MPKVRKIAAKPAIMLTHCRRGALASVNLQFSSSAPRQRLSELISALGLSSVATATRYDSVACDTNAKRALVCDEENFSFPEEYCLQPLGLSSPRSVLQHHVFVFECIYSIFKVGFGSFLPYAPQN